MTTGQPKGSTMYTELGCVLAINETKGPKGWVFTVWELTEDQWVKWLTYTHPHFYTGWVTAKRRARLALLEGARPDVEARCPELKALADYYREWGSHQNDFDNTHWDQLRKTVVV